MLKITLAYLFILLMINSGLLVSGQIGILPSDAGTEDLERDVDTQALLTEQEATSIHEEGANPVYWLGRLLHWFVQVVIFFALLVFGYIAIIYSSFPQSLWWVAGFFTTPLLVIQIVGIFQLVAEVKRAIPFM